MRRCQSGALDHMPLRCLRVDDNDVFLETASLLLEREGLTVVGMASSIAEALQQARALRPDLILVGHRARGRERLYPGPAPGWGRSEWRQRSDLDFNSGRSRL